MATKRIFSINGSSINNLFNSLFAGIRKSKFIATSRSGNNILTLPLILVIIIAILFPVSIIVGVIMSIAFKISISIEKEIIKENNIISNQ